MSGAGGFTDAEVFQAPWDDGTIVHRPWFHVCNLEHSKLTEEELLEIIHRFRTLTKRGPTHIGMNGKHAGEWVQLCLKQRRSSAYESPAAEATFKLEAVKHPEKQTLLVYSAGVHVKLEVVQMLPDGLLLVARKGKGR